MGKVKLSTLLLLLLCLAAASASAQTENLLQNPNADNESLYWRAMGQAFVEDCNGNRCFAVRNGGYFIQDVAVPETAVGKYAVLIGRGSSERINQDGAITGLPSLYGYMMDPGEPKGGHVFAYLTGQQMLGSPTVVHEWVKMCGIFKVPMGTGRIRFFLSQAERKGVPHNGSAAHFDDLGLYVFSSEEEAKAFIDGYNY